MTQTIMIMAGGTGGHVFPALAVAEHLKQRGWNIVWIGTPSGMENKILAKYSYPLVHVDISGIRGNGISKYLMLPFTLLKAFLQARSLIKKYKPNVILGMGGFTSFPGGYMASWMNKPLIIHEQNAVAGLANRILSKYARATLVAYPKAFEQPIPNLSGIKKYIVKNFNPKRVLHTGNPVRSDLVNLSTVIDPESRILSRTGPLRILILGGSRGAQALNQVVPEALKYLPKAFHPHILHQTGENTKQQVLTAYTQVELSPQVNIVVKPFIENMAEAYAWCDLIICRSGALTLAEISALGIASILVPFPHAVDDHQTYNARYLSEKKAGILIPQKEFTAQRLATLLSTLTRDEIARMAVATRQLGRIEATAQVAEICSKVAI